MQAVLVQPPFVQLNAPYPAIHYLAAFLESRGQAAEIHDHSIELYRALFSREGLEKVFADVEAGLTAALAGKKGGAGDEVAQREIWRYLSYKPLYLAWIDGLVDFLAGRDPAFAHRLAAAAELPRGSRAEAFLEAAGGRIRSEEAAGLATAMLEDLADLIRHALDPDFGTVRYGDRLARSHADFDEVTKALDDAWFIRRIYAPWLKSFWAGRAEAWTSAGAAGGRVLVLLTIPFPGCLAGALACARAAREALGNSATIVFGGGYVSTELRGLTDARLFDFCDWLSFDAGYGSLASVIARLEGGPAALYRTMYRKGDEVVAEGFEDGAAKDFAELEEAALRTAFPDYRGVDFRRYLGAVDSGNAMHRLWSDSPWLKYSLAHGCYWRRCSFCDTELDYVANFVPASIGDLLGAAERAARSSGLHGIHFVDEAMPMAGLLAFARANRERTARGERPFSFWGNVRFDASWSQGRCEYLAASGLVAVSGGIEIATESGLELTDKGFDLAGLVRCLVAMKRSGLLVHAYLIYGFPGQAPADIVDSAEAVRQLFASGLVDSAFWHRFVLTRHSRMMAQYREGGRPGLKPILPKPASGPALFASNDLGFEGEAAFDSFDAPLVSALAAWMAGEELERPAYTWFPGKPGRKSAVAPGLVEALIARAETALDARAPSPEERVAWVAGLPLAWPAGLSWAYRGSLEELRLDGARARRVAEALGDLERAGSPPTFAAFLEAAGLGANEAATKALLDAGLVLL